MTSLTILWLRQDLRLQDNPALAWAAQRGAVLPVYIWDTGLSGQARMGSASAWWLHHALEDLGRAFHKIGGSLILRKGDPGTILKSLVHETNADAVAWNRCYEPHSLERDEAITTELEDRDLIVASHNGSLLVEPWEVKTGSGGFYKVYTPFSRACLKLPFPKPKRAPARLQSVGPIPSDELSEWRLLPMHPDWSVGIGKQWKPTLQGGASLLRRFVERSLDDYKGGRDRPGIEGTSRMSPYLHFGQISPRTIWHEVIRHKASGSQGSETYLKELLWREFSYHLLYHFPQLPSKPFNKRFARFGWKRSAKDLSAWQTGLTGYPIVDAGMRQLWQTGWMHNRIRMVVASFLVKDLLLTWQEGAAWFWDTLVDADLANNSAQWQWVAGCGADAAPYFRVFNPVLQGKKFDREGVYVKRFVPELGRVPARFIHEPWRAPPGVLEKAGVVLGQTYPRPIVDHDQARKMALQVLKKLPRSSG